MNIRAILADHKLWLDTSGKEGKKVCFHEVDLQGANLQGANLQGANLQGADLQGANLQGADLRGADLRGADLQDTNLLRADLRWANLEDANLTGANLTDIKIGNCIGNGREVKTLISDPWIVSYTTTTLAIGCQQHPISEWWEMDDATINKMHPYALRWCRKWKEKMRAIIG